LPDSHRQLQVAAAASSRSMSACALVSLPPPRTKTRGAESSLGVGGNGDGVPGECRFGQYLEGVGIRRLLRRYVRVVERRRAVALARHFRESEGLSIAEIAASGSLAGDGQGVLLRPDGGEGAGGRAALRVPVPVAAPTPSLAAGRRVRVLQDVPSARDPAALDSRAGARGDGECQRRFGRLPTSYDWSVTHAQKRGGTRSSDLSPDDGRAWPAACSETGPERQLLCPPARPVGRGRKRHRRSCASGPDACQRELERRLGAPDA
jgi:hypothetical protein